MSSSSVRHRRSIVFLFFSLLTLTMTTFSSSSAVAASWENNFLENLLTFYNSKIEAYFPASALNSTTEMAAFVSSLPSSNASSSAASFATCDVTLPIDDCLERLPQDERTQLVVTGNFLSAKGKLNLDPFCVKQVAPVLLTEPLSTEKSDDASSADDVRTVPLATSIGYGVLFVTVISCCSLGGAVIMPFMEYDCYKKCLMWMVGLAVGTLSGSGLLHLMPHCFGMTPESMGNLGYLHRSSMIFGGIYLFFVTERLLRSVETWRKKQREDRRRQRHLSRERGEGETPEGAGRESPDGELPPLCSMHAQQFIQTTDEISDMRVPHMKSRTPKQSESHQALKSPEDQVSSEVAKLDDVFLPSEEDHCKSNGISHNHQGQAHHGHSHDFLGVGSSGGSSDIATVAWMVIFGDGLHNFIDGLSIGAAFTESVLSGISISVAVICEEFPHELGDFAILLNSGMKFKQALLYNFMSACMCYCGLIFGIILGDTTESSQWIFALAAGMFLYISLVNMVPELNQMAEEMLKSGTPTWLVVLLQHSGIIVGFIIMYLMAAFGGEIDFTGA